MTLSSIEAEPERCADLGSPREKDEIFAPRAQAIQSDSQIRWMDPNGKEERKKLAARLAHETQAIPEHDKENQQTFDSMDLSDDLTEHLEADQENNRKIY